MVKLRKIQNQNKETRFMGNTRSTTGSENRIMKPQQTISFWRFSNNEKDERTWLHLIKYIKQFFLNFWLKSNWPCVNIPHKRYGFYNIMLLGISSSWRDADSSISCALAFLKQKQFTSVTFIREKHARGRFWFELFQRSKKAKSFSSFV